MSTPSGRLVIRRPFFYVELINNVIKTASYVCNMKRIIRIYENDVIGSDVSAWCAIKNFFFCSVIFYEFFALPSLLFLKRKK